MPSPSVLGQLDRDEEDATVLKTFATTICAGLSLHLWDQRVTIYHSVPNIRMLHLTCILVYLATS